MKNKITKLFYIVMIGGVFGNVNAQISNKPSEVNVDNKEVIENLAKKFEEQHSVNYAKALEIAKEQGMPLKGSYSNGAIYELVGYNEESGKLKYYTTFNNKATKSGIQTARVQHLHNGGSLGLNIEGQGINIGVWDGGQIYAAHNDLGVGRVTTKDNSSTISLHATHVAGTIAANGSSNNGQLKGMAPQSNLWANDWVNDLAEMTTQAGQGLLVSNHSYGAVYEALGLHNNPSEFGRYMSDAKNLDAMLFLNEFYLPVYAAGNARNGMLNMAETGMVYFNTAKGGDDLMHGDAVSKNAVVVAAVEGITDYAQPSDVVMSNFSQWGPTDDFRIKPDISSKGVGVLSTGISNPTASVTQQGTSMAAPSVTGVFALWQQYFKALYPTKGKMRAATVKALMAISADEAGSYKIGNNPSIISGEGPDHRFGWGLINAKKGAEILRDSKTSTRVGESVVEELTLSQGQTYTLVVSTDGKSPLKAAIAWTDPAGNIMTGNDNSTPVLVNDLDLRIVRSNGQEVLPWALNRGAWNNIFAAKMDNIVDPIEVVEYKGAATGLAAEGDYTIKVTHKGTLNGGSQKFSLIVSGIKMTVSNKTTDIKDLKVFPNPTTDVVNISGDIIDIADAKVEIFDTTGKKVYDNPYLFYNVDNASIDISGLQSGVYMLKLTTNTASQTVKIIRK